MIIQDSQTDPSLQMVAGYLQQDSTPDFVRQGHVLSKDEISGRLGFAMPERRKFPCHDKVACYLSHLYFYQQADRFTDAQRRQIKSSLERHAVNYGIGEQTSKIAGFFDVQKKLEGGELAAKVAETAESQSVADLVEYAREITRSGGDGVKLAVNEFMSRWAFDAHFLDFPFAYASLKSQYGDSSMLNELKTIRKSAHWQVPPSSKSWAASTPRQIHTAFPQIMESIVTSLPQLDRESVRKKIACFAAFDSPVICMLGRYRFKEADVLPELKQLHKVASNPLVSDLLPDPLPGWQEALEADTRPERILRTMQTMEIPCYTLK